MKKSCITSQGAELGPSQRGRLEFEGYKLYYKVEYKCAGQTARMHRLGCAFAVCMQSNQVFSRRGTHGPVWLCLYVHLI